MRIVVVNTREAPRASRDLWKISPKNHLGIIIIVLRRPMVYKRKTYASTPEGKLLK